MTSTVVECLQGIQTAKEAAAPEENGSGNLTIRHEHFTRGDNANTRYTMCSNAEKITKSHPIGSERFQSIWMNNFKIRNLYAKNITFACSLPTSTSTWRSDHRIRPSGYMSGELKSENINTEKAPTRRSHHPAKDPQSSHHIQPNTRIRPLSERDHHISKPLQLLFRFI
jgi:hypothetical protein